MKRFRNILKCAVAVLTLCLLWSTAITADAAAYKSGNVYINRWTDSKGNAKSYTKQRMVINGFASTDVEYASGDKITKLKVNKKGLAAAVTYEYDPGYEGYSAEATISLCASKTGTYKVSFTVVDANNRKRGSYKVTVQVVANSEVIKKATFGKQVVEQNLTTVKKGTASTTHISNKKVSGKDGKLKITPNSQYKITGIVVQSVDKNGKWTYKKIKNGKKITLSRQYAYISKDPTGTNTSSRKKVTYIYVSYKDPFTGNTDTYSLTKSRGRKEIKNVWKNGKTGVKRVTYGRTLDYDFGLWQY